MSNLTLLWKGAVMQLAARPYAMAGAALLGAGVLIAPPAVPPPPLPLPVESVQVQLDQAFVPGQIIGQIVTNVIGDTVLLAGNIFTGLFGPPPSGLFPSLIQAPITFVTELIAGTPFLNALGDALALPIVALLNLGHDVVAPVVFITVRATEALVAAAQASGNLVAAVFNGVPLATALADWQQAILTVLQTPLPPGSGACRRHDTVRRRDDTVGYYRHQQVRFRRHRVEPRGQHGRVGSGDGQDDVDAKTAAAYRHDDPYRHLGHRQPPRHRNHR